ncbi:ABC transporter permease [Paracoccus sp. TK19116]|uniref:ABC transporter permease n=1 Tax=Paracoccus albicereus TaxID=2922394 RepID=A0ABT1MT23_9RHOB|nr:ABC transporter permease [Paracoccus albicereus]MCQ0971447.1 ABC transporter permease [Paracoccus albicereus]
MKRIGAQLSPPGLLFAVTGLALLQAPFLSLAPNRIALGEGVTLWRLTDGAATASCVLAILAGFALGLLRSRPALRLAGAVLGLIGLLGLVVISAPALLEGAGEYARVSPAAGFWGLLVVMTLLLADSLTQFRPRPLTRALLLALGLGAVAIFLRSDGISQLSVMQEYAARSDAFMTATRRHLALAFGSLGAAAVIGFPLGILCHRKVRLRGAVLPVLSFLQTIPSLAMFGIMIPILGWVAANVPGASEAGIAGIGFTPAFFALLLYSLLPVVSNTVAGLASTPAAAREAARGMGMTTGQRLMRVELPLGLPVLLAGLRIVLVQNIGLAVIAGLIGGGGYGSFVFQGLNQTATDLILLGALPTVLLALVSAVVMDILVDLARPNSEKSP